MQDDLHEFWNRIQEQFELTKLLRLPVTEDAARQELAALAPSEEKPLSDEAIARILGPMGDEQRETPTADRQDEENDRLRMACRAQNARRGLPARVVEPRLAARSRIDAKLDDAFRDSVPLVEIQVAPLQTGTSEGFGVVEAQMLWGRLRIRAGSRPAASNWRLLWETPKGQRVLTGAWLVVDVAHGTDLRTLVETQLRIEIL